MLKKAIYFILPVIALAIVFLSWQQVSKPCYDTNSCEAPVELPTACQHIKADSDISLVFEKLGQADKQVANMYFWQTENQSEIMAVFVDNKLKALECG